MSDRLLLDKDHMVVSKPGFDATNPSLSEGDKLFDSNWLFSGTVVAAGLHVDTAGYRLGRPPQSVIPWNEPTDTSSTQVINFDPLPFVPTVLLLPLSDSRYWQQNGMVLLGADKVNRNIPSDYYRTGEITVTNSQIIIPRSKSAASPVWYYREDFIYIIMAM